MRAVMETAGFRVRAWDDVTDAFVGPAGTPPHLAARLIMGAAVDEIMQAQERNRAERRIVMIQAVLERSG
jgi:hypothetical protein